MKNNLLGSLVSKAKEKKENIALQTGLIREEYKPTIDYDLLEINSSEKELLIEYEKKLSHHISEMRKNIFDISEALFLAQKSLSNHHEGTFCKWYEMLGLKKDFVYMCLKRYNLYLEYKLEKVFNIPDRSIKDISKLKSLVSEEKIITLLNSSKISEELKELKKEFSVRPKTEKKSNLSIWINKKTKNSIEFITEGIFLPKNNLIEDMIVYSENGKVYIKIKEEFLCEYEKK